MKIPCRVEGRKPTNDSKPWVPPFLVQPMAPSFVMPANQPMPDETVAFSLRGGGLLPSGIPRL